MHLVKREERASMPPAQVGGLAGWIMAWAHTLWRGATMRRDGKRQMCVIETLSIGGRKQLVLVSCGGEQFLVGTGAESVQTIVRVPVGSAQEETPQARGLGERL